MKSEHMESLLQDDWWAGEDEAWEAGALALAADEPRSLAWTLTLWLALVVVACVSLAAAAAGAYRLLGILPF